MSSKRQAMIKHVREIKINVWRQAGRDLDSNLSFIPGWLFKGARESSPSHLAGKIGLFSILGDLLRFFSQKYFLSANYDKSLITKLVLLRWLDTIQSPFFVFLWIWVETQKRKKAERSQ